MDNDRVTFRTLWRTWITYIIKLLMTIPEDGLAQIEGREVRKKSAGTAILWIMIAGLAIASITNLASRANAHKEGLAATVAGTFIALLVPVIVHYATKMEGRERLIIWAIGLAASVFSGVIQYQIYAPIGDFSWFGKDNLEALAFGCGVPLSECALAFIAAIVERRGEENAKVAAASKLEEQQTKQDEERSRIEYELELEQRKADAEHKRRMDEIDAKAKADAKRIKAENSGKASVTPTVTSGVTSTVTSGVTSGVHVHPSTSGEQGVHDTDERHAMLQSMLQSIKTPEGINKSKLARELNVSRATIIRDLKALESSGRIILNGSVKVNHD